MLVLQAQAALSAVPRPLWAAGRLRQGLWGRSRGQSPGCLQLHQGVTRGKSVGQMTLNAKLKVSFKSSCHSPWLTEAFLVLGKGGKLQKAELGLDDLGNVGKGSWEGFPGTPELIASEGQSLFC